MAFIASCATSNYSQLDNYDLCKRHGALSPLTTAKRVAIGISTFGLSEIVEKQKEDDFKEVRLEMDRRGLKACDARTLASYDCEKIHGNQLSPEFQTCVLTVSNSIAARRASDAARRAAAEEAKAAQQAKDFGLPSY